MFKTFLQYHNKSIQLLILLSIWAALFLIGIYAQTLYIQKSVGISADELAAFLTEGLYEQPNIIFGSNVLFQLIVFLIPALVFAYLAHPQPLRYLGLERVKRPPQALWVVLLAVGLVFFIGVLATWIKKIDFGSAVTALDDQRQKMLSFYLQSGNLLSLLRNLLLIALLPAICEEVFFRGVIQKFAYSFTRKWWLSILITAGLFTLFHASVSEFIPILLAGLVLGIVYYLTGNLWLTVLLHFVHNGLQVIMAYMSTDDMEEPLGIMLTYFLVAGAVVGFSLWQLYRNRTVLPPDWSVEAKPEQADA